MVLRETREALALLALRALLDHQDRLVGMVSRATPVSLETLAKMVSLADLESRETRVYLEERDPKVSLDCLADLV